VIGVYIVDLMADILGKTGAHLTMHSQMIN